MRITIPEGFKQDAMGRLVPVELIPEIDMVRDELIAELIVKAEAEARELADLRIKMLDDIEAFVELSGEKYGKKVGGQKGNVTLTSYNGKYRVIRNIDEYFTFDERLQIAKALIDECIIDWSHGSRPEIIALVNDAFQVDQAGKVNMRRILGLRRLDIQDEKWQQAMTAISDSLTAVGSRTYVRLYKQDETGKYRQIQLSV